MDILQAALVAQIVVAILVFIAGAILWKWGNGPNLLPVIGFLTCLALFALMFLIRDKIDVIFWGLLADLIITAFVVGKTGGSEVSCFVPLYLMLPTYAVVVGEPLQRVAWLYGAALVLYILTFFADDYDRRVFRQPGNKIAVAVVTFMAFGVTYFLDWRSHDASKAVNEELAGLHSKYEVGMSLEQLDQKLTSVDINEQERILQGLVGKHVTWTVRFVRWYAFEDSKAPDPKTLEFAIQHPPNTGPHSLYYKVVGVDLRRLTSYPPDFEPGDTYNAEGVLVRAGSSDLIILVLKH
jgi:hypothetical protein